MVTGVTTKTGTGDLTDMLETGQSRVSFHLKTVKQAGLLRDRCEGRWIYYASCRGSRVCEIT
jgi:DNA-binding transcriptional ArsR family regulator